MVGGIWRDGGVRDTDKGGNKRMSRYTSKNLEADVENLNLKLKKHKHRLRFQVGGRYEYTAIDLYDPKIMKKCGGLERTLICGTPRECLAECHAYIVGYCT
jgi:hypothetical protein